MTDAEKKKLIEELFKDPDYQSLVSDLSSSRYYLDGNYFFGLPTNFITSDFPLKLISILDKCNLLAKQDSYNIRLINTYIFSIIIMTHIWNLIDKEKLANKRELIYRGNKIILNTAYGASPSEIIMVSEGEDYNAKVEINLRIGQYTIIFDILVPGVSLDNDNYLKKIKFHTFSFHDIAAQHPFAIKTDKILDVDKLTIDELNKLLDEAI